jgi:hypothetical protein
MISMASVDIRDLSEVEYEDMTVLEKVASQVAFIKSGGQDASVLDEDYDDAETLIAIVEGRENNE